MAKNFGVGEDITKPREGETEEETVARVKKWLKKTFNLDIF